MEAKADAERYHRYNEPDPEMEHGGYRTTHKPSFATMANLDLPPFRNDMGPMNIGPMLFLKGGKSKFEVPPMCGSRPNHIAYIYTVTRTGYLPPARLLHYQWRRSRKIWGSGSVRSATFLVGQNIL